MNWDIVNAILAAAGLSAWVWYCVREEIRRGRQARQIAALHGYISTLQTFAINALEGKRLSSDIEMMNILKGQIQDRIDRVDECRNQMN